MQKNLFFFCFLLFLVISITNLYPQADHSPVIHPYLQGVMDDSGENDMINVYIVLKDRLNYSDLKAQTYLLSRKERKAEVVRILKEYASVSQNELRQFLSAPEMGNRISDVTYIWAINVISFKTVKSVITELASGYENIQSINYDKQYTSEELIDDLGITKYNSENNITVQPLLAPQPGLTLIRAPLVWAEGDSGRGILVANIDTGTDWKHPDLVNNIWQNLGEDVNGNGKTIIHNGTAWVFDPGDINGVDNDNNGFLDDFIGWNWENNTNDVTINSSHGTATSGIVAGYGTNGTQTGVAPGARLIILKPSGESQYWIAQQYALEQGVDIITSSLSYKWYFSPKPNYPMFRQMTDIELAAGVVHTNSTSNDGGNSSAPIPYNISAPGNCPGPWVHPDQTLVGGISSVIGSANVNASTDNIVSSSPYGPAAWENIQQTFPTYPYPMPLPFQDYPYHTVPGSMALLKPDVAAPGGGTTSTAPGGGYQSFSGTSGATPHLAGVAALMLGVNPNLEPADVSRIMQLTAVEKGTPGKDNRFGAGRVDAYDAYLQARFEIPVELTSFTADQTPAGILLNWITATEMNNKGFDLERKTADDQDWTKIIFINGKGTTTEQQNYSYTDEAGNLLNGTISYRLKQSDYDGSYAYSPVIFVTFNLPEEFALYQNYPNPFNPSTVIKFSLPYESIVKITAYNMLGQEAAVIFNELKNSGYHEAVFDASGLSSGIYFYNLEAKSADGKYSFNSVKKMVLIR